MREVANTKNQVTVPQNTMSLATVTVNSGLWSRYAWQMLFAHYRQKPSGLDNMDSMLCDLGIIESYIAKMLSVPSTEEKKLVLYWSMSDNGYTDIKPELELAQWFDVYKLEITYNRCDSSKSSITVTPCNVI